MRRESDTDSLPLDGDPELTTEERLALRKLLRDEERASWAWRQLRVLAPVAVAVVVGMWQFWDWLAKHVKVTP